MLSSLIIFFIIINLILIYFFNYFSKIINIYDFPDNVRKFQKKKIPLLGGFIFLMNIFFLFLIVNFFNFDFFIDNQYLLSFFFPVFLIFLIGVYDDKFNLSPYKKFFFISSVLLLVIYFDEGLRIKNLYFSTFNKSIFLGNFSIFFTILCFLLFINALNMFDGINLQTGSYFIILILFFIINKIFFNLSLILLLPLIFFLYLNYRNKTYLGDSGTHIIAYIICYIIVKQYNFRFSEISCEKIFILMMLPGLDMFRLFIERLMNFKNPFKPDRNHIHHLLINVFNFKIAYLIINLFILLPILLISLSELISIIFGIISYIVFLYNKKRFYL